MRKTISLYLVVMLLLCSTVFGNEVPVADAGSSRYAGADPVQLDGTGSYDPDDSGALGYQWQQISGPTVVITGADTATPTISGFTQTGSVQQCQFELVVSDGDLTSLPDTVEVIIVPSFSGTTLVLENPPFDPDKPTLIFFAGGSGGGPLYAPSLWEAKANIISFSTPHNGGKFAEHGNAIITYLSSKAPNYNQPVQTTGMSNGGKHPAAVGAYLNMAYADRRYNVNQATLWDPHDPSLTEIEKFLNSSVDGEQSWVANYRAEGPNNPHPGPEIDGALNVCFPLGDHSTPMGWYLWSINPDWLDWIGDVYNGGIVAGAYLSVAGKGKNLELASYIGTIKYYFQWHGPNYGPGFLEFYDETSYPGRLPEPVTLVGPNDGDFVDANGVVLSCEESENAVGYQLLMGSEPYRVADYNVISDTPYPPNEVITTIPFGRTWWTVRAYDQYGSTIYADPQEVRTLKASSPSPGDGASNAPLHVELNWSPGFTAASHDVYLGTNSDEVNDANRTSHPNVDYNNVVVTTYDPGLLEFGQIYYWRVDEVNGPNTWAGDVWSFTVTDHIVVDDMESYNTSDNMISDTWLGGGYYNWTGAWLYLWIDPCEPIHAGQKSMKYDYDSTGGFWGDLHYYSEIERTFADPCDWSASGIKALALYFYGDADNDANDTERMYVGLKDTTGTYAQVKYSDYGEDTNDVKIAEWHEWNIRLQDFNDGGVDLADVNKVYIGFGDRSNLYPGGTPGGSGVVYFDDIRLYPPKCVPWLAKSAADFDNNCIVDSGDFAILANQWKHPPGIPPADIAEPPDGLVEWKDLDVLTENWLEVKLWPPEE
ncbi:MAG: PKD domain-containing protein [Planctomycetota bacterium]